MNPQDHESTTPTGRELADYAIAASTGLGILILALAPLVIPFLVLTAVFALPLLLPPLALALIGAILAAPVLLVRRLLRARRRGESAGDRSPQRNDPARGGAVVKRRAAGAANG